MSGMPNMLHPPWPIHKCLLGHLSFGRDVGEARGSDEIENPKGSGERDLVRYVEKSESTSVPSGQGTGLYG